MGPTDCPVGCPSSMDYNCLLLLHLPLRPPSLSSGMACLLPQCLLLSRWVHLRWCPPTLSVERPPLAAPLAPGLAIPMAAPPILCPLRPPPLVTRVLTLPCTPLGLHIPCTIRARMATMTPETMQHRENVRGQAK